MKKEETKRLIEYTLKGDVEAFSDLITLYMADVWHVLSSGLFTKAEIDDLCQDVFIAAYNSLETFQINSDFSHWLKGIARNKLKMQLRNYYTNKKYLNLYRDHIELLISEEENNQQENYLIKLRECRNKIGEESSHLLNMHYDYGMPFAKIAEVLGRSLSAVKTSVCRIRASLKKCIEKEVTRC